MTKLSPKAKAIMDVFDNEYYHKAKLRQVAIAATLRELVNQFDDWGGDEPSCCVFREIADIIDELENL